MNVRSSLIKVQTIYFVNDDDHQFAWGQVGLCRRAHDDYVTVSLLE